MKNSKLILASLVFLISCTQGYRNLASFGYKKPPELENLLKASEEILSDVETLADDSCLPYLSDLEKKIDGLDVVKLPREELLRDAEAIAKNSWKIRQTLHSRLDELDERCVKQAQANFRQLRFVEDYLLEIHHKVEHLTPSQIDFEKIPVPMLEQRSFYSLNLVEEGPVKFESGDLLITRGLSMLSAMIARMGDRGSQFSHIVTMNKKPDGEVRTIESYVGIGVSFYDLNTALRNTNARIFWIRAKDSDLAKKASDGMSAEIERLAANNQRIKYDYELDFKDPTTMSCAEVSQVAFQRASKDEFKIPFYPNSIHGAKNLMQRLKIPEGETYSPGDMEIDPRFTVLGEFADLRLTRDSRQKDAILTKIYEWMDEKNYVLKDNFKSKMAGSVIYVIRKTFLWPLVSKILKLEDFSKEVPRNMVKTLAIINELGDALQKELNERDKKFEKEHGLPMTYMDFYKALEDFREKDLVLYQNKATRKQSKFHKIFRPRS